MLFQTSHREIASLHVSNRSCSYFPSDLPDQIEQAAKEVRNDGCIRAVLLVGGDDVFSYGSDLSDHAREQELADASPYYEVLPQLLLSFPVPTVAAMQGHAISGGLALGACCTTMVLAEEKLYGMNFVEIGIPAVMGTTTIFDSVFGSTVARAMLFDGALRTGRELAEHSPSIQSLVKPANDVIEHAMHLAWQFTLSERSTCTILNNSLNSSRREKVTRTLEVEREMIRMHRTKQHTKHSKNEL
ncbi:MAG: enoyl-CoA hydratase-related protein [Planctomycetota bacterium]